MHAYAAAVQKHHNKFSTYFEVLLRHSTCFPNFFQAFQEVVTEDISQTTYQMEREDFILNIGFDVSR